jgi:hypothetical protein
MLRWPSPIVRCPTNSHFYPGPRTGKAAGLIFGPRHRPFCPAPLYRINAISLALLDFLKFPPRFSVYVKAADGANLEPVPIGVAQSQLGTEIIVGVQFPPLGEYPADNIGGAVCRDVWGPGLEPKSEPLYDHAAVDFQMVRRIDRHELAVVGQNLSKALRDRFEVEVSIVCRWDNAVVAIFDDQLKFTEPVAGATITVAIAVRATRCGHCRCVGGSDR